MAGNKRISELTEYLTPAEGDYLAVVDTATHETKKIDFINFKGETGAKVESVDFVGDDMVFTLEDASTVSLEDAKTDLKGNTGESGLGAVIKLTTATAAATADKTATLEGYTPTTGDVIALTLTSGNSAASMTLNINGAGAIAIHCGGLAATSLTGAVTAGGTIILYYDGTVFVLTGATRDTNTTYSEISEAEIDAGTASTARLISGRRTAYILSKVPAASTTAAGIVELAIASEVNTGTSTTLAVTPDALAGSVMGTKGFCVIAVAPTTDVSAADGKAYIMIPECMNGMNLVRANASVITAGTTNATTIDIYNVTDSHDMLSTAISIASAGTIGTAGTVNASYDDVATNDVLRIDVTSASTTNAKGLQIILEFRLP